MSVVIPSVNDNLQRSLPHQNLLRQLGYTFKQRRLFQQALTHRSCAGQNNERLEFLGDSLLNMIIAEALYQKFPEMREGQLSRLRSQLVKGDTLAEIALGFNIGECLFLGEGELKSGGFRRKSILADTVEALIAAIYLDSDFEQCRERVVFWYADMLDSVSLESTGKDSKSALQEWLQAKGKPLPVYTVTHIQGQSHEQEFTVSCAVSVLKLPVVAVASSRQQAEKKAAEQVLTVIQKNDQ